MDPVSHSMDAAEDSGELRKFQESLHNWKSYPDNLPRGHGSEMAKLVNDFKRHFLRTKDTVLLVPPKQGHTGARMRAVLRKIHLLFYDRGTRDTSTGMVGSSSTVSSTPVSERQIWNKATDQELDTRSTPISCPEDLQKMLGFGSEDAASVRDYPDDANSEKNLPLRADPVCRFVFLETLGAETRRFKITEEMLLQILTYHHVSPCFLNFISYFGHGPLTGDGDLFFGGFRSLKSFVEPQSNVSALDRSGYHYQLVFELKTVFSPSWEEDDATTIYHPDQETGEPAGLTLQISNKKTWWKHLVSLFGPGYRAQDIEEETPPDPDSESQRLWPLMQTAIYHHFDVKNGKSLWIITTTDEEATEKYRDVREVMHTPKALISTSSTEERFKSSLDVLTWLGEWSLSDYGFYIAELDDRLQNLTRPYTDDKRVHDVEEKDQKILSRYIESLDDFIVGLQANRRVCNALIKFYRGLPEDAKLKALHLNWMTESEQARLGVRSTIDDFASKMQDIRDMTDEMLRRVNAVKQMGARREDTINRLLQSRNEKVMRELTETTAKDAAIMKTFATITLILLPMSVVSTLFTTDIVRFQNADAAGSGANSPSFAGRWSAPAAVWWTGSTMLATILVFIIGVTLHNVNLERDRARRRPLQPPRGLSASPTYQTLNGLDRDGRMGYGGGEPVVHRGWWERISSIVPTRAVGAVFGPGREAAEKASQLQLAEHIDYVATDKNVHGDDHVQAQDFAAQKDKFMGGPVAQTQQSSPQQHAITYHSQPFIEGSQMERGQA